MAFVPIYILILGFTIVVDYFAGIFIENAVGRQRKLFLLFSIIANVGVLAVFKYYNFLNDNLTFLFQNISFENPIPHLSILLPIGLSFHTFQAMSYTIEVYRGHQKAERKFGIYALYVMFYPQLVAGPIERPQNLLHQFRERHSFDYARITSGLRLMALGLFKKVVIADRLAIVVDNVYNSPHQFNSFSHIVATVFFSFQIFCDFSGYSDMAIGAARIMGFKLMTNFDKPYHSKSIHEFWKRWHISLSSWFRDYLYISLGGNRVSIPRWYLNLFIVFLVSGLWHGANWTFVIWGALNGVYLIIGIVSQDMRTAIKKRLHIEKIAFFPVLTTFILVTFAWIFFRAKNLDTALYISKSVICGMPKIFLDLIHGRMIFQPLGIPIIDMYITIFLIGVMELYHYLKNKVDITSFFLRKPAIFRWALYYCVILIIVFFGVFEKRQFIYFQF